MTFIQIAAPCVGIVLTATLLISCASGLTNREIAKAADVMTCENTKSGESFSFKDVNVLMGTDENITVVTTRGKTVVMTTQMQRNLDCYKEISRGI